LDEASGRDISIIRACVRELLTSPAGRERLDHPWILAFFQGLPVDARIETGCEWDLTPAEQKLVGDALEWVASMSWSLNELMGRTSASPADLARLRRILVLGCTQSGSNIDLPFSPEPSVASTPTGRLQVRSVAGAVECRRPRKTARRRPRSCPLAVMRTAH